MKQEVNPMMIAVSVAVVLCVVIFAATRMFRAPIPTAAAAAPPKATINGHQVPAGAPTAAFQQAAQQAAGGK